MEKSANFNPRLLALGGEAKTPPIALTFDETESFVIGRSSACDLTVKETAASRQHCRIVRAGEKIFSVEDLDSRNGTFVNELPVNIHPLAHGDRIRIGNLYFVFLVDEADDVPFLNAQFDDGTLITKSVIQIVPSSGAANNFSNDLNVLVRFGEAIAELKESESLQRRFLEIILEFIPARGGAILLTGEADLDEARAVCVPAKNHTGTAPMQISRTVSQKVLREQVALLSNDLSDQKFKASESLIAMGVSSLLCVPLNISENKGLIYLDTNDPRIDFTERHLEQMTALSFLISAALENAESIENLRQENQILKDNLQIETDMVGESPPLKNIFQMISRVAPSDSTVLITGESGTGKELVAQAIHRNSRRREKLFVAINCAVLNENLLESELFGHERGAFTGAFGSKAGKFDAADGGTIFFDEIGELAPSMQAKLLRVLQEREFGRVGGTKPIKVNVRVIAATNRNLEDDVKKGLFRSDLFFRLNVVQIKVPPLRERKTDILLLAQHFVNKYSEQCHRKVVGLTKEAKKILLAGEWQGNIRELENVIERAVVLGSTDKITHEDLPSEMIEKVAVPSDVNRDFYEQVKQAKQKIVLSAVQSAGGNFTEAASLLGIHANNLHRIARELGIKDDLKMIRNGS